MSTTCAPLPDDPSHLRFDLPPVGLDGFLGDELPQLGLAAGVADHGGPPAQNSNRLVPRARQMRHGEERNVVPDVKAGRRWVEPGVQRDGPCGKAPAQLNLIADLLYKPAFTQDFEGIFVTGGRHGGGII